MNYTTYDRTVSKQWNKGARSKQAQISNMIGKVIIVAVMVIMGVLMVRYSNAIDTKVHSDNAKYSAYVEAMQGYGIEALSFEEWSK